MAWRRSRTSRSGVVANVSAWNYPVLRGLATCSCPRCWPGNAVLYKPSEFATLTGLAIAEALHEAGVPAAVFAPVHRRRRGRPRAARAAARRRVLHRLLRHRPQDRGGGGAPAHEGAARAGRQGSRLRRRRRGRRGGGQGHRRRRLLQHRPELLLGRAHLRARADPRRLRRGVRARRCRASSSAIPLDEKTYIGPVAREAQLGVLEAQVADAQAKGGAAPERRRAPRPARLLLRADRASPTSTTRMALMREETLRPAHRHPEGQGRRRGRCALMNDTEYGLTAGVYTRDEDRARDASWPA